MTIAKALVGALIAGLTAIATSLDGGLTGPEILQAVIAAAIAGYAVWQVPNRPESAGLRGM